MQSVCLPSLASARRAAVAAPARVLRLRASNGVVARRYGAAGGVAGSRWAAARPFSHAVAVAQAAVADAPVWAVGPGGDPAAEDDVEPHHGAAFEASRGEGGGAGDPHVAAVGKAAVALVREVARSSRPLQDLRRVVTLWGQVQRLGAPVSGAMASAVLSAYSMLGCHTLCILLFRHLGAHHPTVDLHMQALRAVVQSAKLRLDPDTLQLVLDHCERGGRTVHRFHVEALLVTSLRVGTDKQVESAMSRLQSLPGQATPQVYHAMAERAMGDGDLSKAAACLRHLFFKEQWPESFVFTGAHYRRVIASLMHQAVASHDAPAMLTGLQILQQLNLETHYGTLTRVLLAAASQGHVELARLAVTMMESAGYDVRATHLSSCLHAYAAGGDVASAVRVVQDMARKGIPVDSGALQELTAAVTTLWKAQGPGASLRLEHVVPEGVVPLDIINCVLRVYARSGYINPARSLFESAPMLYGVQPTAETYAALMLSCAHPRAPRVSEALDLAQEMSAKGIQLNAECYSALATCLLRSWHHTTEEAYEMVQGAAAVGTPVCLVTYHRFVKQYVRAGDEDRATRVLQDMQAAGHVVTPHLKGYLARCGVSHLLPGDEEASAESSHASAKPDA